MGYKADIIKLEKLEKKNRILRRALRPFANLCDVYDGKQLGLAQNDNDEVYKFNNTAITLGHLRVAKKALGDRK